MKKLCLCLKGDLPSKEVNDCAHSEETPTPTKDIAINPTDDTLFVKSSRTVGASTKQKGFKIYQKFKKYIYIFFQIGIFVARFVGTKY